MNMIHISICIRGLLLPVLRFFSYLQKIVFYHTLLHQLNHDAKAKGTASTIAEEASVTQFRWNLCFHSFCLYFCVLTRGSLVGRSCPS